MVGHKQLATGGVLDKHLVAEVQQQWDAPDADGSGNPDRGEFESLMAALATSEWKEASGQSKAQVYYYNLKISATKRQLPDEDSSRTSCRQSSHLHMLLARPVSARLRLVRVIPPGLVWRSPRN